MSKRKRHPKSFNGNGVKADITESIIVSENHDIQNPPFPYGVSARPEPPKYATTIETNADFTLEYVSRFFSSLVPALRSLPHWSDDVSRRFGPEIYDRMSEDSEVSSSLDVLVLASTSNEAILKPAVDETHPDYNSAVFICDFFKWMFNDYMSTSIDDIRIAMVEDALKYGSSTAEIRLDVVQDGKYYNFLALDRIRTLEINRTSFVVDNYNNVVGIVPSLNFSGIGMAPSGIGHASDAFPLSMFSIFPSSGNQATQKQIQKLIIPRSKFLVFSWREKYGDPRGQSALRTAYTPWWVKQQVISEMMSWVEKFAQPSVVGTVAPNAIEECIKDANGNVIQTISPVQQLLNQLVKLKSASAIAVPYGTDIKTLNMQSGGKIFLEIIDYVNGEIIRSILKQHLATGEGRFQSRAAADVHQDILSLFVVSIKNWQSRSIERDIIKPLTIANFGQRYANLYPRVDLGDSDGFPVTLYEVAQLMGVNYFHPSQMKRLDSLIGVPMREVNETIETMNRGNSEETEENNSEVEGYE